MHQWGNAFRRAPVVLLTVLLVILAAEVGSVAAKQTGLTKHDLAFYLSPEVVNFIRPGVLVKVTTASIAADGTITARVKITDPAGLPLDMYGVNTPGAITVRFIAAFIPTGKTQYLAYTTTVLKPSIPGNTNPAQTQAGTDSGGVFTTNADGDYTYVFKAKATLPLDAAATHSIGVSAQRDLSAWLTYDEWSETANDVYNFVPNGSAVKTVRSIVPTAICNNCHDPLIGHGGSRLTVEMCILCHQPQTINPDTGLTQDMNVLIHKIHMGKNLPSVMAGTPYRIWHRGAWSDFSKVGFPSGTGELMTCTTCHQGGAQSDNYKTNPSRAACGSCHDDVNFASGLNHVNLPQYNDSACAQCHQPTGKEFDASIVGAHTVATRSTQLPGVVFSLAKVTGAAPGKSPTVQFTVKDKAGNTVDITKMAMLNLVIAGPTTDYNGSTSEDVRKAVLAGSTYTYTFTYTIPAAAKGSFVVGIEGYNNVTINPGTVISSTVRDVGFNQVIYFSADGSPVAARRQPVTQANCATCHGPLLLHGGIRQNVEYCLVCHNPTATDVGMRPAAQAPSESINLKTMIHKLHTGDALTTTFTIYGHGGSVNSYNDVGYPGDRRNCAKCHTSDSNALPVSATAMNQVAPRDYMNPLMPTSGACLSCHTLQATAAHASIMTSPTLGESCYACHGPGMSSDVDKVHAR